VWVEKNDPALPSVPEHRWFFPQYPASLTAEEIVDIETRELARKRFFGDAVPKRFMNFGAGSVAACMGSRVESANATVWFHPLGKALRDIGVHVDVNSHWHQRIREMLDATLAAWGGAVQVGFSDIGGNLDVLASLRGTQDLLTDLYDDPETVEKLVRDITREWLAVYDAEAKKIGSVCRGFTPWAPIFSKEKCYMLQCDFSYMISVKMFERLVVPDLTVCCERIPASFYHLDGKGAVKHLDSLLAIEKLKGVQWVPGDGQPRPEEWPEVLKKIRKAGKFCQIFVSPEGALKIKSEIGLEGFILRVEFPDAAREEDVKAFYQKVVA
jgi:5-methyltetrahydrofolate--homocysteine methyltransferase